MDMIKNFMNFGNKIKNDFWTRDRTRALGLMQSALATRPFIAIDTKPLKIRIKFEKKTLTQCVSRS